MLGGRSLWSLLLKPLLSDQHPAQEVPPLQSLREAWAFTADGQAQSGLSKLSGRDASCEQCPSLLDWGGVTRGQEVGTCVLATLFSMSEIFNYLKCL